MGSLIRFGWRLVWIGFHFLALAPVVNQSGNLSQARAIDVIDRSRRGSLRLPATSGGCVPFANDTLRFGGSLNELRTQPLSSTR